LGGLNIFQKYSSFYYSEIDMTIIMSIGASFFVIIHSLITKQKINIQKKYLGVVFLIAIFLFGGIFLMNTALHKTSASVVAAIVGSSAMITTLIGIIFYKERFLRHQYLGIVIIILSLFFLNYFTR
jgi:drug/metabolite transporter (DMT)-like permease